MLIGIRVFDWQTSIMRDGLQHMPYAGVFPGLLNKCREAVSVIFT